MCYGRILWVEEWSVNYHFSEAYFVSSDERFPVLASLPLLLTTSARYLFFHLGWLVCDGNGSCLFVMRNLFSNGGRTYFTEMNENSLCLLCCVHGSKELFLLIVLERNSSELFLLKSPIIMCMQILKCHLPHYFSSPAYLNSVTNSRHSSYLLQYFFISDKTVLYNAQFITKIRSYTTWDKCGQHFVPVMFSSDQNDINDTE